MDDLKVGDTVKITGVQYHERMGHMIGQVLPVSYISEFGSRRYYVEDPTDSDRDWCFYPSELERVNNVTIETNDENYIVEWDVYGVTKSEVFNRQDVAEAFATGLNVKSLSTSEWESIRVSKITKEATNWKPKSNI